MRLYARENERALGDLSISLPPVAKVSIVAFENEGLSPPFQVNGDIRLKHNREQTTAAGLHFLHPLICLLEAEGSASPSIVVILVHMQNFLAGA